MTFNASIPLNANSPSVFPTQNQTNMNRLKTMLEADHQFNLSATANDGYHNLVHMIPQAPTGALAGIGRFYVKVDTGVVQLFYMDDTGQEYQITPTSLAPTRVTGSVVLAGNTTSATVYTIPDNTQATVFVNYISPAGNAYSYSLVYKSGTTFIEKSEIDRGGTNRPSITISGSDIKVVNNSGSSKTVGYYIVAATI